MIDLLQTLDESILVSINSWNTPFLDSFMWWVSGKFSWWPLYLILIVILFYQKGFKKGGLSLILIVLLIAVVDQTSVHLFKEVFQRPRPSHNPAIENILHYVNAYKGGMYGFISSHAANCFAVAVFLFRCYKRVELTILLFLWSTLVSYSRMYLGVHYLSDVLAGALWGVVLGIVFSKLSAWLQKQTVFNP